MERSTTDKPPCCSRARWFSVAQAFAVDDSLPSFHQNSENVKVPRHWLLWKDALTRPSKIETFPKRASFSYYEEDLDCDSWCEADYRHSFGYREKALERVLRELHAASLAAKCLLTKAMGGITEYLLPVSTFPMQPLRRRTRQAGADEMVLQINLKNAFNSIVRSQDGESSNVELFIGALEPIKPLKASRNSEDVRSASRTPEE